MYDTRQALLEWDFVITNGAMKSKTKKAAYGLWPLDTNSPGRWHSWTKRMLLVTSLSSAHSMFSWLPLMSKHLHIMWLAEARKMILSGHRAKLSRHGMWWKENLIRLWFSSLYQWHTEQNNNYLWIIKWEYLKEIITKVAMKPLTSDRDLNPWRQNSNTAKT